MHNGQATPVIHHHLKEWCRGGHRGPPLHKIIGQLKSYTTHHYGRKLWQRSYYEHVIRGERDYRDVWHDIETNPLRWQEDEYYCEE